MRHVQVGYPSPHQTSEAAQVTQIFVDIETQRTRDQFVIERLQAAIKPPGNYKKPESITQWWASEGLQLKADAANRTALDGTYGSLATIGFAIDSQAPQAIQLVDEVAMLTEFTEVLHEFMHTELIAFNGDFDFRFLMKRYVINNLRVPFVIQRALQSRDGYYDPMRAWEGFKGYISQQELERVMGIVRHDSLDGSQVGDAIDVGDWAVVINHNKEDIRCLREIYRRMTQ